MLPKRELPYKQRQRVRSQKKTVWQLLWGSRTVWGVVGTLFGALGTVISWLATDGPEKLQNIRKIPSELEATNHAFQSWYYDDVLWTGTWSSREEYTLRHNQASLPIQLTIKTIRGEVFGEIFSKPICDYLSPPVVMVRGRIQSGKLQADAHALIGGKEVLLYSFIATRDTSGFVLTLSPIHGSDNFIPVNSRIVRAINEEPLDSLSPTTGHPDLTCELDRTQLIIKKLREEGYLKK